jgi:hypothetical protein
MVKGRWVGAVAGATEKGMEAAQVRGHGSTSIPLFD